MLDSNPSHHASLRPIFLRDYLTNTSNKYNSEPLNHTNLHTYTQAMIYTEGSKIRDHIEKWDPKSNLKLEINTVLGF